MTAEREAISASIWLTTPPSRGNSRASDSATSVAGVLGPVRNVRYPDGEPGPQGAAIYCGRVRIEGEVERRGGGAAAVELAYQACDERRCLPPVTRLVRVG